MVKFCNRISYTWHRAVVAFVVGLLLPSIVSAQGAIDNPAPGSVQSGAGLITGWMMKCSSL